MQITTIPESMSQTKKDTNSILSFYKDLIQLHRFSGPEKGTFKPVKIGTQGFYIRERISGQEDKGDPKLQPPDPKGRSEGNVLISNYKRGVLDGKIYPWEGVIVG